MDRQNSSTMWWFIGGAAVSAISILMMSPETGERARRALAQGGGRSLGASGLDLFQRGKELFEKGREIAEDAAEFFERTSKLSEDKSPGSL